MLFRPFVPVLLATAAAAVLAACATQPDAKSAPVAVDSAPTAASGATASGATASGTTASVAAASGTPDSGQSAGTVATSAQAVPIRDEPKTDTSKAHLLPSRTKQDETSYLAAIRAGNRALPTWPTGPTPLPGAILPGKRIVAFYGNPLSKRMGVLGEYATDVMLAKLDSIVALWRKADPSTPVQPALHLIAVVAQGDAGRDGMWRRRMDSTLINRVYGWAKERHALLFLDIQVGHSTLPQEIPRLLPYLANPDVHLGIDAEFSMHYNREGLRPGTKVGQFDASDVNYASAQLAKLVSEHHLPPKILIVHRWTQRMISNAPEIKLDPRVQIVMDMDGWGPPWLKFDSYRDYIVAEPVQFTGFKIFFRNDAKTEPLILTPGEVLRLRPSPLYIQYQ